MLFRMIDADGVTPSERLFREQASLRFVHLWFKTLVRLGEFVHQFPIAGLPDLDPTR